MVISSKPLGDIKILLVESDGNMGSMLMQVLVRMGFKQVQLVRDGQAALEALETGKKDICITEWQLPMIDGLTLTQRVRRLANPDNRLIPIIMTTARAERQDVEMARDSGITEFVVKPFNSATLYKRIQQVIDNPRGFLVAPQYVGPDRRRRVIDVNGSNRRFEDPSIVTEPPGGLPEKPQLVIPDFVLKKKLGNIESLDLLITPKVLEEAQRVIDELKEEGLAWVARDVAELSRLNDALAAGDHQAAQEMMQVLLSVKGQAGTFGYDVVCGTAHQLYQFIRYDYSPADPKHAEVVLKHVQSLKVLLSHKATGRSMDKEHSLLDSLRHMIILFSSSKK